MLSENTKFSFSYDYLMFKVGDVVSYMTRDVTEFTARGVTQSNIDDFETQGNTFEDYPPDSYYQIFVTQEVTAKNEARADCTEKARKIAGIVEQVYGNKSGVYKGLKYNKVNGAKDDSFISLMRLIAKVTESFLTDLTGAGLTQAMIDDLRDEAQVMEDKFHAVATKEAERDNATEERITLANALYELLAKYCQIGKSIWEDVSEAKYNDYVINPTVHSGLAKPQNLTAEVNPIDNSIANLNWDAVAGATSYKIYYSGVPDGQPSGEFIEIEEVFGVNEATTLINQNNRNYWKIRAFGDGKSSTYSDEVFIQT